MNISIIGAAGGVGRELVVQLLRDRVLDRRETLQLIGADPHTVHPHLLQGFRADVLDAYAESAPHIEVSDDVEHISGDIMVMAAGHTLASAPDTCAGYFAHPASFSKRMCKVASTGRILSDERPMLENSRYRGA